MKIIKILALFIICQLTIINIFGQKKKEIKNNKVTSITSITTLIKENKEISYKDNYTVYDKNGCIIEETEFHKDGSIKHKEEFKYNSDNDKIEEKVFSTKDKNFKKFDIKDKSFKKTYTYNNFKQKTEEAEFDESEKLIKKTAYKYNKNGLKIEKITYDGNNKQIEIKKYNYTYR